MSRNRPRPAPPSRRYSDQEVSRILRRAAELQADEPGATGTSLAELEEDLQGRLRDGVDARLTARAMLAVGLELGGADAEYATAFAARLFRGLLR